jgi:hypothetical protein
MACQDGAPEGIADRFVDAYFVAASQARALEVASGVARHKLQQELALVDRVRKDGYTPDQARGRVDWRRQSLTVEGDRGRAEYAVDVDLGGTVSARRALLLLRKEGGAWRVANFEMIDPAAGASPTTRSPRR